MKKFTIAVSMAAIFFMGGCSKEMVITPAENLVVEYGEKLDQNKLFDNKKSDEGIKVDKVKGFDNKKVGTQNLQVTFTDGDRSKDVEIKITVEDTAKPVIKLKKNEIKITAGDKLNLNKNIESVKDRIDGELKYSKEKVEKSGYYIDKGKLDTKKAGTYTITVKAYDANGNKTEKSYKVKVEKKVEVKQPQEETPIAQSQNSDSGNQGSSPHANSGTGNTGGSSGSNSGGGQSSSNNTPAAPQEKPTACVSDGNFGRIGNSGQVFYSEAAADAFANEQLNYGEGPWGKKGYNGYHAWSVYDNCGERNDVWTVEFY